METNTTKITATSFQDIGLSAIRTSTVTPLMPAKFPRNGTVGCTIWRMILQRKCPLCHGSFSSPMSRTTQDPKWSTFPYSTTRPKIEEWVPPKGNWLTGFHYLQLLITPGGCFVRIKKMLYEKFKGINDLNDRALCHYCVVWILECFLYHHAIIGTFWSC